MAGAWPCFSHIFGFLAVGGHLQQPLRCCPWTAWYEGHWPFPHKSVLLALSQSLKVVSTPEPREPLALQKPAFAPDFSTGSPMALGSCKSGDTIPQVYADQFVCKFAVWTSVSTGPERPLGPPSPPSLSCS